MKIARSSGGASSSICYACCGLSPPPAVAGPSRPDAKTAAKLVWAQLPRTFGLVLEASKKDTFVLVFLTIVGGLIPLATAYVGKLIVDGVLLAVASRSEIDRNQALIYVAMELGLVVAMAWVNRSTGIIKSVLGAKLGFRTNVRILEKSLELELKHFEDPAVYDKLQNARREASARPLGLFLKVIGVGRDVVSLISYGVVMTTFSPLAMLVLVVATLPALIGEAKFSGETFNLYTWRAPEGRRLNYYEWVLTRDNHIKEVKLYGLGDLFLDRYRKLYRHFFDQERSLAVRRMTYGFVLGLIASAAFYGVYAWIVIATMAGRLTLGEMTMLMMIFRQAQGALRGVLGAISGAYEDGLFMSNLFAFLDLPSEKKQQKTPEKPLDVAPLHTGFVLEDVSFKYPGAANLVLDKINLRIGPEEKLAIVGENGAGKTTLIKLLTGLYAPTSGRITLDGVPLQEIDPAALRSKFGIVLQDFVRYQLSAQENVGLGAPEALEDRHKVEHASKLGGGDEVIAKLPKGWETQLGRWFEGGLELSAGQWQKLAVSRAFMRDAEILILDEPSASLDAEAEHALFERFRQLTKGKMALLISHRFSTVRMADRIAVIQNGRLTELGTHTELLARDGRYARLFRLQAEGYIDAAS